MASVLVTGALPPGALGRLTAAAEVEVSTAGRWRSRLGEKDGLLCFITDRVDEEVLASADLRMVANFGVGYDNIDVAAATRRGILVSNTPAPELTETTADLAFALLLAAARRIPEGDRLGRSGRWRGWRPDQLLGRDVHGATLGILGPGRIGQAVARRASGFGMEVLLWGRRPSRVLESTLGARFVTFGQLLRDSDFVSVHLPLTRQTHHLISDDELGMMKCTAYPVNTARDPIVHEAALTRGLATGTIAGAALDVYEFEPNIGEALRRLRNVVLLPHLGSATHETREAMGRMAVENLLSGLGGRRHPNLVSGATWRARGRRRPSSAARPRH